MIFDEEMARVLAIPHRCARRGSFFLNLGFASETEKPLDSPIKFSAQFRSPRLDLSRSNELVLPKNQSNGEKWRKRLKWVSKNPTDYRHSIQSASINGRSEENWMLSFNFLNDPFTMFLYPPLMNDQEENPMANLPFQFSISFHFIFVLQYPRVQTRTGYKAMVHLPSHPIPSSRSRSYQRLPSLTSRSQNP